VVCVRPSPIAAKLVRRGYRLAKRFQGRFWVIYVRTPGQLGGSGRRQVESIFELARELGGEAEELSADSVGDEILRFARGKRATFIVMGQSRRSRVDEIVRGSLITRIIREIDHVDVLVIADPSRALPVQMEG
jgi:two-component system, OmpR family, sensor histidine kinase KdpD